MKQNTPNFPWDLSIEMVRALIGLNSSTAISIVKPAQPFGGYTGEKTLISISSSDAPQTRVLLKNVSKV